MAKYKVLSRIQAGDTYEIDSEIDLEPKSAKELIAIGAIDPKPIKPTPPPHPPKDSGKKADEDGKTKE